MSSASAIEWTDATWNPVRGCMKISPGCKHCYAETFAERFRGVKGHPYEQGFDPRIVPDKLDEPLRWKKPRMVFVNSMSDLFLDRFPDRYIDQVFAIMAVAGQHTYQVLTKRADRMAAYTAGLTLDRLDLRALEFGYGLKYQGAPLVDLPLPNVWLGVSVEDQQRADERIPHLLRTPAAIRFLSCEPLLGPVDLTRIGAFRGQPLSALEECVGHVERPRIDWVIVGGESGPGARPFDTRWARSIVQQCKAARVPVFVKQLGANARTNSFLGSDDAMEPLMLLDKKGGDPAEWPPDLRIRQYPEARR
jgi:protein gp37